MVDPPEGRAAEIRIQCARELQELRPIGASIIQLPIPSMSLHVSFTTSSNLASCSKPLQAGKSLRGEERSCTEAKSQAKERFYLTLLKSAKDNTNGSLLEL